MVHITDVSAGLFLFSGLLSIVLLGLALRAYHRTGEATMGFVAGAFTVFAFKSFVVGYSLFAGLVEHTLLELIDGVGDLATVLLFVVPILVPRR